jgi:hypothetical protein
MRSSWAIPSDDQGPSRLSLCPIKRSYGSDLRYHTALKLVAICLRWNLVDGGGIIGLVKPDEGCVRANAQGNLSRALCIKVPCMAVERDNLGKCAILPLNPRQTLAASVVYMLGFENKHRNGARNWRWHGRHGVLGSRLTVFSFSVLRSDSGVAFAKRQDNDASMMA